MQSGCMQAQNVSWHSHPIADLSGLHRYPGCAPDSPGSVGQNLTPSYSRSRQAIVGAAVGEKEGELDGAPVGPLVSGAPVGATVNVHTTLAPDCVAQEASPPPVPSKVQ